MINTQTAEKLVKWYNGLGCVCPLTQRLQIVLGMLGGGVNAASVRSRPFLEDTNEEQLPLRVTKVIERVLIERSLARPDTAAAAFGVSDKLSYCSCNNVRSNHSVSAMTAWVPKNENFNNSEKRIITTCPSCTFSQNGPLSPSTTTSPIPLPIFLSTIADSKQKCNETLQIYSSLINASGGIGRGTGDKSMQQYTFNGSWTCLLVLRDDDNERKDAPLIGLDAEILISNKVSSSVRLQPKCICSDLLYCMLGILAKKTLNLLSIFHRK